MAKDNKEKMREFFKEYEVLCYKHKMYIGSCGCCGSPWITDTLGPGGDIELSTEDVKKAMQHLIEWEELDG